MENGKFIYMIVLPKVVSLITLAKKAKSDRIL